MTISLRRHRTCGHCGRDDLGSVEAGFAVVGQDHLCCPHVGGRPRCFELVTRFGHPMGCRCAERLPRAGGRDAAVWS